MFSRTKISYIIQLLSASESCSYDYPLPVGAFGAYGAAMGLRYGTGHGKADSRTRSFAAVGGVSSVEPFKEFIKVALAAGDFREILIE